MIFNESFQRQLDNSKIGDNDIELAAFDDDEDADEEETERLGYNTDRKLLNTARQSDSIDDGRIFEDGFEDAEYPSVALMSSSRDESLDQLIAERNAKARELDQELSQFQKIQTIEQKLKRSGASTDEIMRANPK